MKRVICFGEVLWDLFPSGRELGGAPANFALRIQSLGHPAFLVSSVGKDPLGAEAFERLQRLGLATRFVQEHPEFPTGTVKITVNAAGEPDYHIVPGVAYDAIAPTGELERLAREADWICFGTLAQRSEVSRQTLHKLLAAAPKARKVADLNLRKDCYSRETIERSLEFADLLKLNEQEVGVLGSMFGLPTEVEEFAKEVCARWGISWCVVTRGREGVYARTAGGEECRAAGYPVDVVDTCGAGDAFTAGFLSELMRGAPLERCCAFGNALGALVAGSKGATSEVPRERVEALIRSRDGNSKGG